MEVPGEVTVEDGTDVICVACIRRRDPGVCKGVHSGGGAELDAGDVGSSSEILYRVYEEAV